MKRYTMFFLLFILLLGGCSSQASETPVISPQIVCGEGRNIVVSSEKKLFLPPSSGDIEPLLSGECTAFIPQGGSFIFEWTDLIVRFTNGQIVNLPREGFSKGFTFYWQR
ncbi:MAG: hypothetical protein AB9915_03635 [Candidatus Dojkabacteria bacterium]